MSDRARRKLKILTDKQRTAIADEVKMMLHAHRDCLRNRFHSDEKDLNPKKIRFSVNDGYYGEAFGIVRALEVLGYGYYGAVNTPTDMTNLRWWFYQLEEEVLKEENFRGSGECDHCVARYGKDDAGRSKWAA